MASEKKITMREYNGTDYDTLYPKTIAEQVDGIYSNDEVLSNSTKALYGLTDSAVPDNVLALLSRFQSGMGNEYVWEKGTNTSVVVPSSISAQNINSASNTSAETTLTYSDYPDLSNPSTVTFSYKTAENANVLAGKFFKNAKYPQNPVLYGDPNGTVTKTYSNGNYIVKFPCTETYRIEIQHVSYGYVNSPDPNAYPPAVSDGYTYTPLGQMGAKVQIATGSYTGTDTYGENNPNSLTFEFEPKLVIVGNEDYALTLIMFSGQRASYSTMYRNGSTHTFVYTTWGGNTVSWYGTKDMYAQQNNGGYKYYYIAIG